jgi:hypothetical protein
MPDLGVSLLLPMEGGIKPDNVSPTSPEPILRDIPLKPIPLHHAPAWTPWSKLLRLRGAPASPFPS